MKIAILWKNDYPWDVRIEKFSQALSEAGHDVFVLCSNKRGLERWENLDGITIRRLPFVNNRIITSLISTPFYLNPFWFQMADQLIKKENIDVIIVRDLPLALIGVALKAKHKLKLVLDIAENYHGMYSQLIKDSGANAIATWFIKNPYVAKLVERYAIRRADHIFAVIDESVSRLIRVGVEESKISVVSNTPLIDDIITFNSGCSVCEGFHMCYVGFIRKYRGLDIVIKSLPIICEVLKKPVFFHILGDGDYLEPLKTLAEAEGVKKSVRFYGWVPNHSVHKYIAKSDIGVIPHLKNAHTDTTIPNKIFDFMACGKPVIVSNAAPMRRIVIEESCGTVFESGDIASFVNAFHSLTQELSVMSCMGANGRMAIERRYNWSVDAAELKRVVSQLRA